jgi:hypothetical protein
MASLTWAMVTDAQGQVAEVLHMPNRARKGKTGGRTMPLHPDLQAALVALQTLRGDMATPERPILFSERGGGLSPAIVRLWLHCLYTSLEFIPVKPLAARGSDTPGSYAEHSMQASAPHPARVRLLCATPHPCRDGCYSAREMPCAIDS